MNTNEFRLGNLIHPKYPMRILNIGAGEVYCDFDGNEGDVWEFKAEDIEPIIFTPELMLKNGFEFKNEDEYHLPIVDFWVHICITATDNSFCLYDNDKSYQVGSYPTGRFVKYVHNFQNLVFALTNKEFDFKP